MTTAQQQQQEHDECECNVLFDLDHNTWLVDLKLGIKDEWGYVLKAWRHMSKEDLEASHVLLQGLRQATPEELEVMQRNMGMID